MLLVDPYPNSILAPGVLALLKRPPHYLGHGASPGFHQEFLPLSFDGKSEQEYLLALSLK